MKAAILQLNSGDDPARNLAVVSELVGQAAGQGAEFILTPEVTNCVSQDRAHQVQVLQHQDDDITLTGLRNAAVRHGVWLSIGSLALKTGDADGRFANRSFMIDPAGQIVAQYDKIHMFDVTVSPTESYRESAGYRPGERAAIADTPFGRIGMSICYDVRFPELFRQLVDAGATVFTVPAAFTATTGEAHWHVLLRARAIENLAYVIAAGQYGEHPDRRSTYGHSLIIDPWGRILAEAGDGNGFVAADIDPSLPAKLRSEFPALVNRRL